MSLNVLQVIDSKTIYRDYLIRYYPCSKDRHTNYLIGMPKLKEIVNRKATMNTILKRVAKRNTILYIPSRYIAQAHVISISIDQK